ncbi:MAG: stage II sporulation protein M [Thermotaleaceae bacterium]
MKEHKFIEINQSNWERLEKIVHDFSNNKLSHYPSNTLEEFLFLFRAASHHLAYVRTHYPQSQLEKYLNALVGSAHHHLYSVRKNPWHDFKNFVTRILPEKFYQYQPYILSSFLFFLLGAFLSFTLVYYDPSYSFYFIPQSILENIDYSFQAKHWDYALMSSTIFINNINVSLRAFVYGIFLGIGTMYILLINGALLGALSALVYVNGDVLKYLSLILPHGILELTAIFMSGAAGLLLGKALILPGKFKRLDFIVKNGKEGMPLVLGAVLFLSMAALIEGFFTPLPISPLVKLCFSLLTLIGLLFYLSPSRF